MDKSKETKKRNTDIFNNDSKAAVFILIGKSFRGKSYACRYLIYDRFLHAGWKFGIAFVGTKYSGDYSYLPEKSVFQGYNEDVLKKWLEELKKKKQSGTKLPMSFVFFDDLVGVLTQQTPFFTNFITTARHLNINIIICVQYIAKGISTTLREQTTFALMFRSKNQRTLKYLYESYGQLFETFDDFKEYFFKCTEEEHVFMLYIEKEDELERNYIPAKMPPNVAKYKLKF